VLGFHFLKRDFFDWQGRTRVFVEAYIVYVADEKPAENAANWGRIRLKSENLSFVEHCQYSSLPFFRSDQMRRC